jgi:hypothetical protein
MNKAMLKKKDNEENSDKKDTRKAAIKFILVVGVIFLIIWFGREYLASKTILSTSPVVINGKERVLVFSQKTSGNTAKERMQEVESVGPAHYGYFLELLDKTSNKSLDEVKFKSPVWHIQQTPEVIVRPDGVVWIVSTTRNFDKESPGFILKFSIKDDKLQSEVFEMEDNYRIRQIQGNRVMLSEGTKNYSTIYPQALYLDLETSRIVDERK